MNNNELTMVIPDLSRKQARELRDALIEVKKTYAPNAKGSIQVGKKDRFTELMNRCKHCIL